MNLDDAYDNLGYIPGAMDFPPAWEEAAQSFRQTASDQGYGYRRVDYGTSARQHYDLFTPASRSKGLCVFVHGGYWRRFEASLFSHLAKGALAHGWSTALPSYDLCPQVRISEITRQIAEMLTHAGDGVAGPISLVGHSAGGHLVSRLLAPGLLSPDLAVRLQSVTPISPVADLRPLLQTSMNEDFRLTADEATAESPVLMADRAPAAVHVWVGEDERPAFLDQARWLSEAWNAPLRIAPGKHHLDVIEALADPESAMVADIIRSTTSGCA
ncbi:MAG: alpha/beta hydrolase [Pseudomonadota bacterium]